MKKALLLVGAACAAVLATTGCASVNTNDAAASAKVCIKKECKADIEVGEKAVSGEATVSCLFGFITWGVDKYADDAFVSSNSGVQFCGANTVAKQGATYNACDAAKADYILGAKYQIDTKDYFVYKTVKCKVTGFPGTLKGIK